MARRQPCSQPALLASAPVADHPLDHAADHAADHALGQAAGTGRTRLAGRLGTGLLLGVAASLTLTALPGSAAAAPGATHARSAAEATRLVSDAGHQLEAITEQVNEATETLTRQRAAARDADRAMERAQAQRDALDAQMRSIARSAFTGENMSRVNALMTSGSAEEFLAQVNTLDALAGHADEVLAEVAAAEQAAQQAKTDASAATAAAQQTLQDVKARQADMKSKITDYKAQFAALSAPQRQAVVEESSGPTLTPPTRKVSAPSGAAQKAVDVALAQLGDPYVWAASGPNSFDCSGLMQYAYAAAGISLPHSSRVQSTMGTPVSRADLQPGDLVFFYQPISHVGMYIGDGRMVHASTSGSPVKISSVDRSGYVTARRLVG